MNKKEITVEQLEQIVKENPKDTRALFCLGQGYQRREDLGRALEVFEKRAGMGGVQEEVLWSLFSAAQLHKTLGTPGNEVLSSYKKAWSYWPERAEPLFWMAEFYFSRGAFFSGYLLTKEALRWEAPKGITLIDQNIYNHDLLSAFAHCAYQVGRTKEALAAWKLLLNRFLPMDEKQNIQKMIGSVMREKVAYYEDLIPTTPFTIDGGEAKLVPPVEGVLDLADVWGRPEEFDLNHGPLEEFEKALAQDPTNTALLFQFAQTLQNVGEYKSAHACFSKRATLGGSRDEVFWSLLSAADLEEKLQASPAALAASYRKVRAFWPERAEGYFWQIAYYFSEGDYLFGYLLAKEALQFHRPKQVIYVDRPLYDYKLLLLFADCAYRLGRAKEAMIAWNRVLKKQLPVEVRHIIKNNLEILGNNEKEDLLKHDCSK